jgi:hypothetical protein
MGYTVTTNAGPDQITVQKIEKRYVPSERATYYSWQIRFRSIAWKYETWVEDSIPVDQQDQHAADEFRTFIKAVADEIAYI